MRRYAREKSIPESTFRAWLVGDRHPEIRASLSDDHQRAIIGSEGRLYFRYVADCLSAFLQEKRRDPEFDDGQYALKAGIPHATLQRWLFSPTSPQVDELLSLADRTYLKRMRDVRDSSRRTRTRIASASVNPAASNIRRRSRRSTPKARPSERERRGERPATVEQVATALVALGCYTGDNSPTEHAEGVARHGGPDAYRVFMVNVLLGLVQAEAMMADEADLDGDARHTAWEAQFKAVGVEADDLALRAQLLRWQVLRTVTPLWRMTRDQSSGPIPLAAVHGATGLQLLLGVITKSQKALATGDMVALGAQAEHLQTARESFQCAIDNTQVLLDMLKSVGLYSD